MTKRKLSTLIVISTLILTLISGLGSAAIFLSQNEIAETFLPEVGDYEYCFEDYVDNYCHPFLALCQMGSMGACGEYNNCISRAHVICQYGWMSQTEDEIILC